MGIDPSNLKAFATPPKCCAPSKAAAQRDLTAHHGLLLLHLRTAHFPVLVERLREHHRAMPELRQLQRQDCEAMGVVHILLHSRYTFLLEARSRRPLPYLSLQPGYQVQTGCAATDGRGRRKHTNAEPGWTARMGSTGATAPIQIGSWAMRTALVSRQEFRRCK